MQSDIFLKYLNKNFAFYYQYLNYCIKLNNIIEFKMIFFSLMVIMQLYQGLADDWKKNIFPYIHGSITLDIKNLGDAYNFPFWAVTSADLNRVRITKDGDLILAYYIGLVNPPYEYISFNFDYSNVLVRMNMRDNPGLTEWAKSIYTVVDTRFWSR